MPAPRWHALHVIATREKPNQSAIWQKTRNENAHGETPTLSGPTGAVVVDELLVSRPVDFRRTRVGVKPFSDVAVPRLPSSWAARHRGRESRVSLPWPGPTAKRLRRSWPSLRMNTEPLPPPPGRMMPLSCFFAACPPPPPPPPPPPLPSFAGCWCWLLLSLMSKTSV